MAKPTTTPACLTCKFFELKGDGSYGPCHRYPPTYMFGSISISRHQWVPTQPDDWCGEYIHV